MVTLKGFGAIPANTFAEGSPSGGNDGTGKLISANGRTAPFDGQPVQGFSDVQFAGENSFWFLSDNGFGNKNNSADYLLRIYKVDPNFAGAENGDGSVEIQDFIQLADPNNLIPFGIVNENSKDRPLTGADFDPESIVIDRNGDIWIGEEFGPYLLHFDSNGTLLEAPIATPNIFGLNTLKGQDPIVIAHRGVSGQRPEHTLGDLGGEMLAAYNLAISQGADFIEPDLVSTKDGVLIARHENALAIVEMDGDGNPRVDENGEFVIKEASTNVANFEKFRDRLTTKVIDGKSVTGWFSEDFTLEEIKELKAIERIPGTRPDNTQFDGFFQIPTLGEIIEFVKEVEAETGRKIGIYPETKHPTYFAKEGRFLNLDTGDLGDLIGIDLSQLLVDALVENGFTDPERIFIQSFEFQNLLELQNDILPKAAQAAGKPEIEDIPLVQLYESFSKQPYDVIFNFREGNPDANPEIYDDFPITVDGSTNYQDLAAPEVLQFISDRYAQGIGPSKRNIVFAEPLDRPFDGNGNGIPKIDEQLTGEVSTLIDDAHAAGLLVHPFTFRNEETFLVLDAEGNPQTPEQEYEQFIRLGVDGFFSDFTEIGKKVRDQIVADEVHSPQNRAVLARRHLQ